MIFCFGLAKEKVTRFVRLTELNAADQNLPSENATKAFPTDRVIVHPSVHVSRSIRS